MPQTLLRVGLGTDGIAGLCAARPQPWKPTVRPTTSPTEGMRAQGLAGNSTPLFEADLHS